MQRRTLSLGLIAILLAFQLSALAAGHRDGKDVRFTVRIENISRDGFLYVSGPGGLWVISPEGKHLGTIIAPKHPHNMAWGDEDGKTLYLCARSGLYRMRLNVAGVRPVETAKN